MTAYGDIIKRWRSEAKLSRRKLSDLMKCSETHLRNIESGKRTATLKFLKHAARALNKPKSELDKAWLAENMEGISLAPEGLRKIPVIPWVQAGTFTDVDAPFQPHNADDWIWTESNGDRVFALRVNDDSMEQEFQKGDTIVINPHTAMKSGDHIIVKNENNEVTFKQILIDGERWRLHPLNSKYPDIKIDNLRLLVVGVIVEKRKQYR